MLIDRRRKTFAAAALVSILTCAAVLIADSRYQFLFARPRVPVRTLSASPPPIFVSIDPNHGLSILQQALGNNAPPSWVLGAAVPYELAVLLEPDCEKKVCTATFAVNTRRLSPLIAEQIAKADIPATLGPFVLDVYKPTEQPRGILCVNATAPIDDGVAARAFSRQPLNTDEREPTGMGSHFLEAYIDNRNNAISTMLDIFNSGGFISLQNAGVDEEALYRFLGRIAHVTVSADIVDDQCVVNIRIACSDSASQTDAESLKTFLTFFSYFGESTLRELYGLCLRGDCRVNAEIVEGEYTIVGFRSLFTPSVGGA